MSLRFRTLVALISALVAAAPAGAASVVIQYADSPRPGMTRLSGELGNGNPYAFNIFLPQPMSPGEKRDYLRNWLQANSPLQVAPLEMDMLVILGLPPASEVSSSPGDTGSRDTVRSAAAQGGSVSFPGFFDPLDINHQPAVFTAGIVTDVGELSASISSAELNFQTEGPIICQALFQRLAPRAPQYGAQINYAGDRLEVYFDPAYTVTQGGIIFGTTSPTPNGSGAIDPAPPPPPAIRFGFFDAYQGASALRTDFQWDFVRIFPVQYQGPTVDTTARDLAVESLRIDFGPSVSAFGPRSARLDAPSDVQAGGRIGTAGTTLEVAKPAAQKAETRFNNLFEPFDPLAQPAVFTAGIVTDVGELSASISSAELNFQTEGPIICQALFQRLAPRAPQYGAQINYAGDRLEIYFDPAYTVTQGGIIFGTSSPSPGCSGLLDPPVIPVPGTGDGNADNRLNGSDIQALLDAVQNSSNYWNDYALGDVDDAIDLNGDRVFNMIDIQELIYRELNYLPRHP